MILLNVIIFIYYNVLMIEIRQFKILSVFSYAFHVILEVSVKFLDQLSSILFILFRSRRMNF
jgi:hypothetical protein